jgi:hypothetical protein
LLTLSLSFSVRWKTFANSTPNSLNLGAQNFGAQSCRLVLWHNFAGNQAQMLRMKLSSLSLPCTLIVEEIADIPSALIRQSVIDGSLLPHALLVPADIAGFESLIRLKKISRESFRYLELPNHQIKKISANQNEFLGIPVLRGNHLMQITTIENKHFLRKNFSEYVLMSETQNVPLESILGMNTNEPYTFLPYFCAALGCQGEKIEDRKKFDTFIQRIDELRQRLGKKLFIAPLPLLTNELNNAIQVSYELPMLFLFPNGTTPLVQSPKTKIETGLKTLATFLVSPTMQLSFQKEFLRAPMFANINDNGFKQNSEMLLNNKTLKHLPLLWPSLKLLFGQLSDTPLSKQQRIDTFLNLMQKKELLN